jgi:hypothetical protein
MQLNELAQKIGARIVSGPGPFDLEIERFCAEDKISRLLGLAGSRTLVISDIADPHIFRVARLLDVPAVCLPGPSSPGPEMVAAADENGAVLLVSSAGRAETLERLHGCLGLQARLIHENRALHD